MSDELNGASITAKERLANIEGILRDMDGKLDNKADMASVIALEGRVREMELKQAFWRGAIVILSVIGSALVSLGVSFAVRAWA